MAPITHSKSQLGRVVAMPRRTTWRWSALFAISIAGLLLNIAPAAAHHIPGATYTGAYHNETLTVSPNGSTLTVNFSPTYGEGGSSYYTWPRFFPLAQGPFPIRTVKSQSKPWDRAHASGTPGCITVYDPYGYGYPAGAYLTSVEFLRSKVVVQVYGDEVTASDGPYPPDCQRGQFGKGFAGGFIGTTSASPQRSEECKWAKEAVRKAKKKLKQTESPQAEKKARKKLNKFKQYLC